MSELPSRDLEDSPATLTPCADRECDAFEAAWQAGLRPAIADHLAAVPGPDRPALLRELILLEIDYRRLAGEELEAEAFLTRFPTLDRAWLVGVLSAAAPTASPHVPAGTPAEPGPPGRLGKFVLLERLGKGGGGTVWRAHDTELDRVVAVKLPDPRLMTWPVANARFRREARAVARLSHPNVVALFDVEQIGATPVLVMEYVAGTDLGRLVEESGPLPIAQACDAIRQAALGLQHAHKRGLVHRDVKPSNLLLTNAHGSQAAELVKVLDLGLARLRPGPGDAAPDLTEPGCMMGTADFMAPEQARDARSADARADVYSLGCTLYFLLAGRVPFPGGTPAEKTVRRLTEEPTPVEERRPDVPAPLAAVVRRAMAQRPEDRYQTAAELADALAALLGGAEPRTAAPALVRRRRRRRALLLVLLGLAAGCGLLLGLWSGRGRPEPPEPFVTNSIGMKLALIRPGRFWMGAADSEGKFPQERPRRQVEITRPFYLGVCEVTQDEFTRVMGSNPSHFTPARGGGPDHPVDSVSYHLAVDFCTTLSARPEEKRAGRVYRLPTEAEWEYACRAGTATAYHFGDTTRQLGEHAWYARNADGTTHPVGKKKPNPWGLHDMYGNVAEWCSDAYVFNYYQSGPEKDPHCTSGGDRAQRVLRGGAWGKLGEPWRCRSAFRGAAPPDVQQNDRGLRVAFTLPGSTP